MLKKLKFQTRLFLYCSVVVIALISLSFASFYLYTSKDLENVEIETLNQLTLKTSDQLDTMFVEMEKIAVHVLSNPNVIKILSNALEKQSLGNYFDTSLSEARELSKTLLSIEGASLPIARTSIFNAKGDYIEYSIYPQQPDAVNKYFGTGEFKELYKNVLNNPGAHLLLEPHYDYWTDNNQIKLISLLREVKDLDTYDSYGVIEIQQPYGKMESICHIKGSDDLRVYLITDMHSIAYPVSDSQNTETSNIIKYYMEQISNKSEGHLKVINPISSESELLTFKTSSFSKWTIVMVKSEEDILRPINVFGKIMLLIGISVILLTLLIIFIITKRMTKPLKELRMSLKTVSLDNLSVEISHDDSNNEFVQLNDAFDSMFIRLKESMEQVMQYQSQEAKAHVLALQSQMDPHFLYNILSIISAISYEAGVPKIADISVKLSNMLRYITSFQDKGTMIENEIEHTKNYLELMKDRYEDRLTFSISADERVTKINVPKLTLQPLVENCFQHAFRNQVPPWIIEIRVGFLEDSWFMEVCDNGSGFDESVLSSIQLKAEEFLRNPSTNIKEMKIGGLGLLNTYIRLKLLYQDKMVFKVESNSGKGTKIEIGGSL